MYKELKEKFTSEELTIITRTSLFIGDEFHTRQGDSVYWNLIEINTKDKKFIYSVSTKEDLDLKTYYSIVGLANNYNYEFEEVFVD